LSKDCVLIQNGKAHEIWRDRQKVELRPMTQELLDCVVEVPAGSASYGAVWNNETKTFEVE
jgi:hypothetical protein